MTSPSENNIQLQICFYFSNGASENGQMFDRSSLELNVDTNGIITSGPCLLAKLIDPISANWSEKLLKVAELAKVTVTQPIYIHKAGSQAPKPSKPDGIRCLFRSR